MTTSNITNTANTKGLKTLIGAAVVSMLLPLSMVLATTAINADSAEAQTTRCTRTYNGVTCRTTQF